METQEQGKGYEEPREEQACPKCGMLKAEWKENQGRGYRQGQEVYCCQGCADDSGCHCTPEA